LGEDPYRVFEKIRRRLEEIGRGSKSEVKG